MRKTPRKTSYYPYKSKFEYEFATYLEKRGVKFEYEPDKFLWVPKPKTYNPDFKIWVSKNKYYYIETKGKFYQGDRTKMKAIKEQYPDLDIRMVFGNAFNKLSKKAKMRYWEWAERHGYPWAHCNFRQNQVEVPKEWFKK